MPGVKCRRGVAMQVGTWGHGSVQVGEKTGQQAWACALLLAWACAGASLGLCVATGLDLCWCWPGPVRCYWSGLVRCYWSGSVLVLSWAWWAKREKA